MVNDHRQFYYGGRNPVNGQICASTTLTNSSAPIYCLLRTLIQLIFTAMLLLPQNQVSSPHFSSEKPVCLQFSSFESTQKPRSILSTRAGHVTSSNAKRKKVLAFAASHTTHLYDDTVEDHDSVYSKQSDLGRSMQMCAWALKDAREQNHAYGKRIEQLFRTKKNCTTEEDLDRISESPCRGLERRLCPIFLSHQQWAVQSLLKYQEKDDALYLRYVSERTSRPSKNFAQVLAKADRKAADEIHAEDETYTQSWSDGNSTASD
jgi:hypothetical protein